MGPSHQHLRAGADDSPFTSAGGFDYSRVESIEVMKGPNGILYGSQTSTGSGVGLGGML